MITVKQHGMKWRIEIEKETWEIDDVGDLKEVLENLIDLKNVWGWVEKDLKR
jgi:hypothetical protein